MRDCLTALIICNQIRSKMNAGPYEDPDTTPGGNALRFYASLRIKVKNRGTFYWSSDKTGNPAGFYVQVETKKNKFSPPLKKAVFPVI
jgi:recombination protein RecA